MTRDRDNRVAERLLAICGAGGFALQILDMVEDLAASGQRIVFVDPQRQDSFHGFPVQADWPAAEEHVGLIALADPATRARVAVGRPAHPGLFSRWSLRSPHASIGTGAILCHHTIIEADARIGRHFHGNIYSYVAHESEIGDFVTFAPRVNCNGRVRIGDRTYVGTGAFLKQGITIGSDATIGMGSVVLHDVPDGAVVVGNPARPIPPRGD